MKSIFKKYRIFFAAAFLLALFFCCRTLFPAFQLQHKGVKASTILFPGYLQMNLLRTR